MICIIADSYKDAQLWANAQQLESSEWFYPIYESDLYRFRGYHVITLPSSQWLNIKFFERIFTIAKDRGRIGRK